MYFSETIVVYDLKLATDDRNDKKFLLISKLCSLGAVCPLPVGYIGYMPVYGNPAPCRGFLQTYIF